MQKILRKSTVAALLDVTPRTVDRWSRDDKYRHLGFPAPIKMGEASVGFLEIEVEAWIKNRAAMRDGADQSQAT